MERKEEYKNAMGMIKVRLMNIENTLANVEMSENVRKALYDEKEELETYYRELEKQTKKTPEEYIARIQDLLESTTNEYDEVIKAYEEFYNAYPERRIGCWYCGEQEDKLNGNLTCDRCAYK